jgi:hypothetical protein
MGGTQVQILCAVVGLDQQGLVCSARTWVFTGHQPSRRAVPPGTALGRVTEDQAGARRPREIDDGNMQSLLDY